MLASIPQGQRMRPEAPSSVSSASGSDVSPPSAVAYALSAAGPGSASGSSSAGSANGIGRVVSLEMRRKEAMQNAASRLAAAGSSSNELERSASTSGGGASNGSPRLVPYASRRRGSVSTGAAATGAVDLRRSDSGTARLATATITPGLSNGPALGSASTMVDDSTMLAASMAAARPGTSLGLYRDPVASSTPGDGGAPLHSHDRERDQEVPLAALPPRAASAMASYGDENVYRENGHPAVYEHRVAGGAVARTPLAETYRQLPALQSQVQATHQSLQQQQQSVGFGKERYVQGAPFQQHQQQMQHQLQQQQQPLMAIATPSMTQQAHYGQQVAEQRYHQQPYQQQQQQAGYAAGMVQQQQQQQHNGQQTPMVEYQVPIQKPVKKGPAVIVVSIYEAFELPGTRRGSMRADLPLIMACLQVNGKAYARAGILGKGGSSRVYRVLDEKNNLFAIKKVDISKNDHESRASFINEIHLLEKLRGNAQIIRLVDSEINDQKKVLLMVSTELADRRPAALFAYACLGGAFR